MTLMKLFQRSGELRGYSVLYARFYLTQYVSGNRNVHHWHEITPLVPAKMTYMWPEHSVEPVGLLAFSLASESHCG